jgi:hypothetical protein
MLGKGIDLLVSFFHNRVLANLAFAALLVLLFKPVIPTINSYLVTKDYLQDDLKPVLSFVEANKQNDDLIYLYHYIDQQYIYYAPSYHLENVSFIVGEDNSQSAKKYQEELSSLPRDQRIWFIFSFVHEGKIRKGVKQDEREYILHSLKENGILLEEFYSSSNVSSAHLVILK